MSIQSTIQASNDMPMIQAFQDGNDEDTSTGQFLFGGVLVSTRLTLWINDGVNKAISTAENEESNASDSSPNPEDGITKLMKQLFQEQDAKQKQLFKEIEDRQQIQMRQTFAAVITEYVQSLGIAIEK